MIGCFPDPYPDELLYSICARYHNRMMYSSSGYITIQELFGNNSRVTIDLPSRLAYLTAVLPPGHHYSVDHLIDKHTLLPFYSPFLTVERVERIRSDMRGNDGSAIHKIAGITPSNIRMPDKLKYCLLCAELNKRKYGEPYWHRLHQLSGVEVCPIHKVFLEESNANMRNRINGQVLISAEQGISEVLPRLLDLSNLDHTVLLRIAQDAAWLLEQPNLVPGFNALRRCYLHLLTERELACDSTRVHIVKLLRAFTSYYSPSVLKQLQCEVDEQKPSTWLARLHKDFGLKKTNHPLRHLLLIQFLGCTAEEFLQDCISEKFLQIAIPPKPFGEGPWPCLNPACPLFHKLKIKECQIKFIQTRGNGKKPHGTFSCICGFVYTRRGPDTLIEDQFRIGTVKSYGDVWNRKLKDWWEDPSLSVGEIARQLNICYDTVRRQASYLGLRSSREELGFEPAQIDSEVMSKAKKEKILFQQKLESRRIEWLHAQAENPNSTRRLLRNEHSNVYYWLYTYDKKWLDTHSPPPFKRVSSARQGQVDWENRDTQLADLVRQSAVRLKNASGRPKHVTISAIGHDLDKQALFDKKIDKLPKTAKALSEVAETREEFAVRRIKWATDLFVQENVNPGWSQLLLRAGVYVLRDVPIVKEALNVAFETLGLPNSQLEPRIDRVSNPEKSER